MFKGILVALLGLACVGQVHAQTEPPYEGTIVSTTTGKALKRLNGVFLIGKSSPTFSAGRSTVTVKMDGASGGVDASSFTAVYGVKSATANFTGTGAATYSIITSSGVQIAAGDVNLPNQAIDNAEIHDGAIDTSKLATDAVTTSKILNLNVTTAKIAESAVDTSKLATDAVIGSKILNGTIDTAKLNATIQAQLAAAGTTTPGGINTDVQYNNSGSMAGANGFFVWNNASRYLGVGGTPSSHLDVYGADTANMETISRWTKNSYGSAYWRMAYQTATNRGLTLNGTGDSAQAFYFDLYNYRLGLGTGAPQAMLDVSGDFSWGGAATKSTGTSTGDLTLASNADLTLTGPTAYAVFPASVTGSAFFGDGSRLTLSSATVIRDYNGNATVPYGVVAATGSFSGSVTANIALETQGFRAKRVDGGQTGGLGIDSSGSNYGTAIYRDDAEAAIFENGGLILGSYLANDAPSNGLIVSGSVGIGTASPASKLHVSSGTLLVDGTGAAIKSMGNIQFGTNGSVLTWDDGAGNQRQMVSFTSALDLNGGNAFNTRIGNGGGNTSIGVTAVFPTTLNVEGNAQFGSGATKSTFTATGQLQVGGTGNSTFYGSTMTVANSGIVTAPSQPGFSASTATVSIPNNAFTSLVFESESFDRQNVHASGLFTVPAGGGGLYLINCYAGFDPGATGTRAIRLVDGGVTTDYGRTQWVPSGTGPTYQTFTVVQSLAAGDSRRCQAFQDSGAALNLSSGRMDAVKLW